MARSQQTDESGSRGLETEIGSLETELRVHSIHDTLEWERMTPDSDDLHPLVATEADAKGLSAVVPETDAKWVMNRLRAENKEGSQVRLAPTDDGDGGRRWLGPQK